MASSREQLRGRSTSPSRRSRATAAAVGARPTGHPAVRCRLRVRRFAEDRSATRRSPATPRASDPARPDDTGLGGGVLRQRGGDRFDDHQATSPPRRVVESIATYIYGPFPSRSAAASSPATSAANRAPTAQPALTTVERGGQRSSPMARTSSVRRGLLWRPSGQATSSPANPRAQWAPRRQRWPDPDPMRCYKGSPAIDHSRLGTKPEEGPARSPPRQAARQRLLRAALSGSRWRARANGSGRAGACARRSRSSSSARPAPAGSRSPRGWGGFPSWSHC